MGINFEKGKSEAILLCRGKYATAVREKWRQSDGELAIPLDSFGHAVHKLRLVRRYKHLGTMIDALCVALSSFIERSKGALASYAPLALSRLLTCRQGRPAPAPC